MARERGVTCSKVAAVGMEFITRRAGLNTHKSGVLCGAWVVWQDNRKRPNQKGPLSAGRGWHV